MQVNAVFIRYFLQAGLQSIENNLSIIRSHLWSDVSSAHTKGKRIKFIVLRGGEMYSEIIEITFKVCGAFDTFSPITNTHSHFTTF